MTARLFTDDQTATEITRKIRDHFVTIGGNVPMRVLAQSVIDHAVIPQGVIDRYMLRGVEGLCRRALSSDTDERIPFAQAVGSGRDATWLQLDLFDREQAFALLRRRTKLLRGDYERDMRLYDWCLLRFGVAPEMPVVVWPESDDDDDPNTDGFIADPDESDDDE